MRQTRPDAVYSVGRITSFMMQRDAAFYKESIEHDLQPV